MGTGHFFECRQAENLILADKKSDLFPFLYLRIGLVCFAYRSMLKMEVRLRTAFCAVSLLSRSSSLVQDTALSRLRHGFKSRTGRLWGQQRLVLSL